MTLLNRLLAALLACALIAQPVLAADINQSSWSETDSANTSSSPNGWPAGTFPNQVEPIGRATMGAVKRFYDHVNATVTSAGSANAQTLTYSVAPTAYVAGDTYTFKIGVSNTGAATLNVNGLGATAIQLSGSALAGGELLAGTYASVVYDGARFQLSAPSFASLGNALHLISGPAAPTLGSVAQVDLLADQVATTAFKWPTILGQANQGTGGTGGNSALVYNQVAFSKEFTSSVPFSNIGEGVVVGIEGVSSYGCTNCGVDSNYFQVVPLAIYSAFNANNAAGVGINVVATSNGAFTGLAWNGIEIDDLRGAAATPASGFNQGLLVQAGNLTDDYAIRTGSIGSGGWKVGVSLYGVTSTGAGVQFAPGYSAATGLDCNTTANATFSIGCIDVESGQKIILGANSSIYESSGILTFGASNIFMGSGASVSGALLVGSGSSDYWDIIGGSGFINLIATGSDTNISPVVEAKGSGSIYLQTAAGATTMMQLSASEITTPNLPTSAGSGGKYLCVDTGGNWYLKSSCP